MDKNELMAKARAAKVAKKAFNKEEDFKHELMEPIKKRAENIFSADFARSLAANTNTPIEHIFKEIKYAASWGRTKLIWDIEDMSPICVARIIEELSAQHYTVKCKEDNNEAAPVHESLVISWPINQ